MEKGRLEAFSDGVIAIIITIMVLELKVPHGHDVAALLPLVPVFLNYILSFIYVGIDWNNHHQLFWLSLIPFVTGWMGENHFTALPTALYGFVLLMSSAAYWFLQRAIVSEHARDSRIADALGSDWKGKVSPVLYLSAIALAFVSKKVAGAIYVLVAVMWFIPDRRLGKAIPQHEQK